ncbi:MAG: hypothetical protein WBA25_09410, partial [Jannaschia sp.]
VPRGRVDGAQGGQRGQPFGHSQSTISEPTRWKVSFVKAYRGAHIGINETNLIRRKPAMFETHTTRT